jgi:hypothetical protein
LGIASISLAIDWLLVSALDQPETIFFSFSFNPAHVAVATKTN